MTEQENRTSVLVLGGSRGCGLFTAIDLIKEGNKVVLLLRNPEKLKEENQVIKQAEEEGRVTLIKGDAHNSNDLDKAVEIAKEKGNGHLGMVVSSLGGVPSMKSYFPPRVAIDPPDLCTRATSLLLPILSSKAPEARLVIVSSTGLGTKYHPTVPYLVQLIYLMITQPHNDKLAQERLLFDAAGWSWPSDQSEPQGLIDEETRKRAKESKIGELIIVRPSLLTDGEVSPKVRADTQLTGDYFVSRKDIGAFIAKECLPSAFGGSDKWVGQGITVSR